MPLGVAASFWAIKVMLMAASLGTILLVWKCARMLDLDPVKAIVLVGLNPIVIVWGLGGDHNDFLTVFAIVLGFYLLLRAREHDRSGATGIGAGAAFVAATALKASAGILIPIVLVSLLRAPRRLTRVLLGMVAAGVVVGAASLIAFGLHIPDLSTQSEVVANESVPNLIGLALGAGGETETLHTLLSGVFLLSVLGCCAMAFSRRWDSITASGWATVALLLTLGWVLPWYVLWLLPLAALSRSRRLRTTALVLGAYLMIAWAPASGPAVERDRVSPREDAARSAAPAVCQGAFELILIRHPPRVGGGRACAGSRGAWCPVAGRARRPWDGWGVACGARPGRAPSARPAGSAPARGCGSASARPGRSPPLAGRRARARARVVAR